MNRITHDRIAKSLVPTLSRGTISKINSHIDNPRPIHYLIQNTYSTNTKNEYNNPYDALELGKNSRHRRTNHDFVSAALTGYMASGNIDGMRAAMIHTLLDKASDNIRDKHGARFRDMVEAVWNYTSR